MAPILELAETYGIPVIEDAAQAVGAQYRNGRCAGSMGLAGCLSFFPSKNLGGAGNGGMVLTNDPDLAARLRILRVHGAEPKYHHKLIGGNFRSSSSASQIQRCFSALGYKAGDLPEAERAARETLALPIYPELTEAQQAYVVDRISSLLACQALSTAPQARDSS
mgnify:CR=1 FL=1